MLKIADDEGDWIKVMRSDRQERACGYVVTVLMGQRAENAGECVTLTREHATALRDELTRILDGDTATTKREAFEDGTRLDVTDEDGDTLTVLRLWLDTAAAGHSALQRALVASLTPPPPTRLSTRHRAARGKPRDALCRPRAR